MICYNIVFSFPRPDVCWTLLDINNNDTWLVFSFFENRKKRKRRITLSTHTHRVEKRKNKTTGFICFDTDKLEKKLPTKETS